MGERLEKTIPQERKGTRKTIEEKGHTGKDGKAMPQKNDGGKGWRKDGKAMPRKGGKSLENQKIDRFKPKT